VWLIGVVVCLLAANRGSNLFADVGNGWPHSALRYVITSCQSAATSKIVKRFWSRTHVRSAVASIRTFTFYIYLLLSNGGGYWDNTDHVVQKSCVEE